MVFGEVHLWDTKPVKLLGHLGVILFFVLSGYLITYLLLAEKKVTETISIKDFYLRRIFRIWPLYFLLILSALFLFPQIGFLNVPGQDGNNNLNLTNILLYLFILPNVAVKVFSAVPFIGQTWSIGVEEQFYLIWPWLVKHSERILLVLTGVIVVYLIILFGLDWMAAKSHSGNAWKIASDIWHVSSIDCMAIGGIAAWVHYHNKHRILAILTNHFMEFGIALIIIFLIIKGIRFPFLHHEIYAVIFSVLILNLTVKEKSIINLEHPVMDYLGKISYGVYMYHVLCIVIAYKLVLLLNGTHNNWMLYTLSVALTILVSAISYQYFEYPFIKMKARFSKIVSGDAARK